MDLNRNTVIAVDFDGTLCKSAWPEIGEENHKLIIHLRQQAAEGARLILWTCRCGDMLEAAVEWCRERGLEFDTVNENLPELVGLYGNDCRKINADIYIDDKAVNPIPYRQAAGFASLNPYKNPIDEREIRTKMKDCEVCICSDCRKQQECKICKDCDSRPKEGNKSECPYGGFESDD